MSFIPVSKEDPNPASEEEEQSNSYNIKTKSLIDPVHIMQRQLASLLADRKKDREERQTFMELLKRLMPQDISKGEEPV